jgi:hypothetical protein
MAVTRRALMRFSATAGGLTAPFDPGALLRGLIVFDHVIVESNGLQEVPLLVRWFGYDSTLELLRSGRLSFQPLPMTVGETGHLGLSGRPVLPQLRYRLLPIMIANPQDHISKSVDAWPQDERVGKRMRQTLVNQTYKSLAISPAACVPLLERAIHQDLQTIPLLRTAIHDAVAEAMGIRFDLADLTVRIEAVDETGWRIETNLQELLGLDTDREHQYVTRGVLNCAGLTQRLVMREHYDAIPELTISDQTLLDIRLLTFCERYGVPNDRFDRVVRVAGLPTVSSHASIDLSRLLQVTSSDEAGRFREWLHTANPSEDEIRDQVSSIRSRLGGALRSPLGRVIRFVVSEGIGLGAGGPAVGEAVVDSWLLEWALGEPSPLLFLTRSYRRLFPDPE